MADPTTILGYAKQRHDAAKQNLTAAQHRLADVQTAIAANSAEVSDATGDFAELEKEAAAIRKRLAGVVTPADGEALLDELEQVIIRMRTSRARILKAQLAVEQAQAESDIAQAELGLASARVAAADAEEKEAELAHQQREHWKDALSTEPLLSISAAADKAIKTDPFLTADKRLKDNIPDKLLTRAEDRRKDEVGRGNASHAETIEAEDAALGELEQNHGLMGAAEKTRINFLRSESAAKSFVSSTMSRFDQARTVVANVADPNQALLTPEQLARLHDASLKPAREAAAQEEKLLDDMLKEVEKKQLALDKAILTAKAQNKDPEQEKDVKDARTARDAALNDFSNADATWRAKLKQRDARIEEVKSRQAVLVQAIQKAIAAGQDPDTDAGVIKAKADLAKSEDDLKKDEKAYEESSHGILHAWEAAVPDAAWKTLSDFEEAASALNALKASDPTKLKNDLSKAEEDYVKAQVKADASANVVEQLAAEQAGRAAREQSVTQAESNRLFSALRGDN